MSDRPRVTCITDADLVHTSFATTGLVELARLGEIELRFKPPRAAGMRAENRGRFTILFRVDRSGASNWGCVDMHDGRAVVSEASLSVAARYYKANFDLRVPLPATVAPFAPYFACRPNSDQAAVRRTIGSLLAHRRERPSLFRATARGARQTFNSSWRRYQSYRNRLTLAEYERRPPNKGKGFVFFNPRFWPEDSVPGNAAVNHLRAEVIRGLQRELGDRFVGGFLPGGEVERRWPDLIMRQRLEHRSYVAFCQQARICIYTNGVGGCLSWKLGEYLAAGVAVVGERPNVSFREPMTESDGFLSFETAERCIEQVLDLDRHPEKHARVRDGARAYYQRSASPPAAMRRVIADL